ncbi:carbon-nitrogen hydrolase family protein [Allokutzneria albata]|uniref:carbon-nitrogen hydrolase family protein n=1 Tax=Allokutzneria albata TaxID=211114 RepID=UPI0004C2F4CB|nr:carbon-nitrogen hydrolase family protein [Allokutzneria albata]
MEESVRIALCQIVSGPDPAANLELVREQVRRAEGADLVVFPEATMACFGGPKLAEVAEPLDGPWASAVRDIALEAGVTVLAGMFTPEPDGRVRNTLLITGPGGHHGYDKIHLFDAFGFQESATVAPGTEAVTFDVGGTTVGAAVCYDVRFPELFRALADRGAEVIVVTASWGAGPGKREQWELLVRARALDTTSWVVAVGQADPASIGIAQQGTAPTGIGYSLVADPFGRVHATLADEPETRVVLIVPEAVAPARAAIPVLVNRRL